MSFLHHRELVGKFIGMGDILLTVHIGLEMQSEDGGRRGGTDVLESAPKSTLRGETLSEHRSCIFGGGREEEREGGQVDSIWN